MEVRDVLALPASGAGAGQGATEQEASPAQLLSAAVSVSARTGGRPRCPPVCQQGTSIRLQAALPIAALSSAASAAQTSSSAPLRLLRLLRAHAPGLLR